MPTRAELAYLAGFFDGEGFVGLHARDMKNRRTPAHGVVMTVCNTKRSAVEAFANVFGGHGRIQMRSRPNPNHRPLWIWVAQSSRALTTLRALRPFLRLKREQADIAIAYAKTLKNVGMRGHTDATVVTRLALVSRIKDLNRRGTGAAA